MGVPTTADLLTSSRVAVATQGAPTAIVAVAATSANSNRSLQTSAVVVAAMVEMVEARVGMVAAMAGPRRNKHRKSAGKTRGQGGVSWSPKKSLCAMCGVARWLTSAG
eukprot:scaffold58571_cov57-Phaeocystis_antarctica.AAC.3